MANTLSSEEDTPIDFGLMALGNEKSMINGFPEV